MSWRFNWLQIGAGLVIGTGVAAVWALAFIGAQCLLAGCCS